MVKPGTNKNDSTGLTNYGREGRAINKRLSPSKRCHAYKCVRTCFAHSTGTSPANSKMTRILVAGKKFGVPGLLGSCVQLLSVGRYEKWGKKSNLSLSFSHKGFFYFLRNTLKYPGMGVGRGMQKGRICPRSPQNNCIALFPLNTMGLHPSRQNTADAHVPTVYINHTFNVEALRHL